MNQWSTDFSYWIVFNYIIISQWSWPFSWELSFGFFLAFSHYKWGAFEYSCTKISVNTLSFLLDRFLILELLTFRECAEVFSRITEPVYATARNVRAFHFFHIIYNICISILCTLTILMGLKWYLIIVVFLCFYISWTTNDVEHLLMDILAILMSSFIECLVLFFPSCLIGLYDFLLSVYEFFIWFIYCKYLFPDCGLTIHFIHGVF